MEKRWIGVIIVIVVVVGLGAFYFFGGISTVRADPDGDHLKTSKEKEIGTDPQDSDTDGDEIRDNTELEIGTGPVDFDTDTDGLGDGREVNELGTDPKDKDTDDDGLNDGPEVNTHGTKPKATDSDGDGFGDQEEVQKDTDPTDPNSVPTRDSDDDGIINRREKEIGSDPKDRDTDDDGLDDDIEINTYGSDPLKIDSDGDGLNDRREVQEVGTDPTKLDSDGGGLNDGTEVDAGIDPKVADTDDDGIADGAEQNWNEDTDEDGSINALDSDSDDDTYRDGNDLWPLVDKKISVDVDYLKVDDADGIGDGSDPYVKVKAPGVTSLTSFKDCGWHARQEWNDAFASETLDIPDTSNTVTLTVSLWDEDSVWDSSDSDDVLDINGATVAETEVTIDYNISERTPSGTIHRDGGNDGADEADGIIEFTISTTGVTIVTVE